MHFYRLLGNHIESHSYIHTYIHIYLLSILESTTLSMFVCLCMAAQLPGVPSFITEPFLSTHERCSHRQELFCSCNGSTNANTTAAVEVLFTYMPVDCIDLPAQVIVPYSLYFSHIIGNFIVIITAVKKCASSSSIVTSSGACAASSRHRTQAPCPASRLGWRYRFCSP